MQGLKRWLWVCSALFVYACSGERQEADEGHVWKEQTDTIQRAKDVDKLMQGAADERRRTLEEQNR